MDNRLGLGDLIREYHTHLHNVPLDINSMKDWDKDEKLLREKLNYFLNIDEQTFNHNFNRHLKIKRGI
jgi:hypothetical protein